MFIFFKNPNSGIAFFRYICKNSKTMQVSLKDNAELQLNVVTIPAGLPVTYSNMFPDLMEVSPAGLIKGKGPGVDTLIVSAADGSRISTKFVVNLTDHRVNATAINVAAAGATPEVKYGGSTFDLGQYVTVSPADAWEPHLTYVSSNTTYATVDANTGVITSGNVEDVSVTITITYSNNFNSTTLTKDVPVKILGRVYRPVDISRTDWTVSRPPAGSRSLTSGSSSAGAGSPCRSRTRSV